jgi:3-oxoacyl-[acyl-carrier protein] reductase
MDLGIEGKIALVMGASKGIGRGCAAALAAEGVRVAIASRSRERIEAAARELSNASSTEGSSRASATVRGFVADASDPDGLTTLVDEVQDAFGPIEILVTNTGGPPVGDPLGFDRSDWEAAYRALVLAPLALIEAVVPGMRERGWGRIVNITSSATRQPIPGLMLSNSHRLAAIGAFKTLANELGSDGILVNSVAPGSIATDRIADLRGWPVDELAGMELPNVPLGRLGTIEEMGDVVTFLCSKRASYVTGVNLLVDGGLVGAI